MIKQSFKRELLCCFIIVALLPLLITSVFLISTMKKKIELNYEKETQEQLQSVENRLELYFEQLEQIMFSIQKNETIAKGIVETDAWTKNKAYTKLYSETMNVHNLAQFNIYSKNGMCLYSTSATGKAEDMPTYWGILKMAGTHQDEMIIRNGYVNHISGERQLQCAVSIQQNDECIGFLIASMSLNEIESLLEGTYDQGNGIAILDSFWEEVYSTKVAKDKSIAQQLRSRRLTGQPIKQDSDTITFYISAMPERGLFLVLGRDVLFTQDITKTMFGVLFVMALLSLSLCLLVATIMSRNLTSPIERMTKVMGFIEKGDLEKRIQSNRKDELGILARNFDQMTEQLKNFMEEQVRQQQQLNDSNVAMMQAQLNPHFLYNTLDTMKWVAKANHVPEIAVLSTNLANILRMSISEAKFVTLSKEVQLVTYYMEIQSIRFNGNFTFDVELPIELEECIVPKLILQPIIENAVIHGLKERDEGHIFLNIYEMDHMLCMEVSDDGCGMDEETKRQLNNREKLKGHIGFYNVDTIIRLYYGDSYRLNVESELGKGTMVSVTLPINKGEQNV